MNRTNPLVKLLALLFAGVLVLAACGDDSDSESDAGGSGETTETTEAPEEAPAAEMDIVDTAVAAGDFTTFAAALEATDFTFTEGSFTVFAPTDEAFAAALEDLGLTAEELLADTETLVRILTYHVVLGEVPAADVVTLDGEEVETVNGATVTISVDGDAVMVNDANVVQTDIFATNGVIHAIDAVLVP